MLLVKDLGLKDVLETQGYQIIVDYAATVMLQEHGHCKDDQSNMMCSL
jgi:hypothetical protein